jgi:O-antigen/teichoic acid export membrane protein
LRHQYNSIIRNTGWNAVGFVAPTVAALISVPALIHNLGGNRFGIVSLIWAGLAYLGLFELGIGRALTRAIASRSSVSIGSDDQLTASSGTALLITAGLVASIIGGIAGTIFLNVVSVIPQELFVETVIAWNIGMLTLPFLTAASGFAGILNGYQRFKEINMARAIFGSCSFLLPMATSYVSKSIVFVAISTFAAKALYSCYLYVTVNAIVSVKAKFVKWSEIQRLFKIGGYMAVSNIISPLMVNMDRFYISTMFGLSSNAIYTACSELINRLAILPEAIVSALFPKLSKNQFTDGSVYAFSSLVIEIVVYVPSFIIILYSDEILRIWISADAAMRGSEILQILTIGIYFNVQARLPLNAIHAAGNPRITAVLHIIELPIYILILVLASVRWGLLGVSIAWTLRVVLDALLLYAFCYAGMPKLRGYISSQIIRTLLASTLLCANILGDSKIFIESLAILYFIILSVQTSHLYNIESSKIYRMPES